MAMTFETFGNAIVQFSQDGSPVLTTDPWLTGTCYFGSWGLERAPSAQQIQNVQESPFVWISHGHPDHMHPESLKLLSPAVTTMLVPDHYDAEVQRSLADMGFETRILPGKRWIQLTDRIRVMSIANENQDGILIVEADGALVINLNDSPLCGEGSFLRNLIRKYERANTYLVGLCSIDADMMNIFDEQGASLAGPPDARKPGAIWEVAGKTAQLGAGHWCCSSSQHRYVREDSIWANPYRISWEDMKRHWNRPEVDLVAPYSKVLLDTGIVEPGAITLEPLAEVLPADDWSESLTAAEWSRVETFIRKFEIIQDRIDFIEFVVGGEARRISLRQNGATPEPARGIVFHVPRKPLLETVEYGYFDDLLIGNFMKTRLVNTRLYPDFSKQVAKIGGNAKVFTKEEHRRFLLHYLRRSPRGFLGTRLAEAWRFRGLPSIRRAADALRVKPLLKVVYRRYLRNEPLYPAPSV